MDYGEFIANKRVVAERTGFECLPEEVNPICKLHQRDCIIWMVNGGQRALFASFGLGKTLMQLEAVRITRQKAGGLALITIPLGVRQEFFKDAELLNAHAKDDSQRIKLKFIRSKEEIEDDETIYLTNFETVRDEKLDPRIFNVASLDEASCLRGFGGTKTFRNFMALFAGDDRRDMSDRRVGETVKYRFVATATPSPNEYIELLAYSAFLGIMDVGGAKTRFFKRDSTKADNLTIHPHKEEEFWLWVSTWGLFISKPSDLGYSDDGYALPPLKVVTHRVHIDSKDAGEEVWGQMRMFRSAGKSLIDVSRERRAGLETRINKVGEIISENRDDHFIIWHDLEDERRAIEKIIPDAVSIKGATGQKDLERREANIVKFSNGEFQYLSAKPSIAGSGCNFQRHCHKEIFSGIGFKFNDFIQAVHRIYRFLQSEEVEIHIIYTEAEQAVFDTLMDKWEKHKKQVNKMTEIIKKYGLASTDVAQKMIRAMGVERVEVKGDNYRCIHNDCVIETETMPENSVDLIMTSIPFSTQYEYSPNYNDFGHTDSNGHFFEQMDYLTPNLLKVLKPGRVALIHVKDRIIPSGMTEYGFPTAYPFHAETIRHFQKHGFGYMGMKTIVTDVVRENNQTYRLGWTEQCKDGSKMGVGMPEYLLIFRKKPSSTDNAYADEPVVKSKDEYTRARWQVDAHGFARSSGNRPLMVEDLQDLAQSVDPKEFHQQVFKMFKKHSLENIYDFEHDVRIGQHLEDKGKLPSDFMLLQPQSYHPDVWTDITRMRTLNTFQGQKGKEQHLCPMQFDLARRAIQQFTMEGETVLDPFGGIMSVPYIALEQKRKAIGIELSPSYFMDGVHWCKAKEQEMSIPDLFDALEAEQDAKEAS